MTIRVTITNDSDFENAAVVVTALDHREMQAGIPCPLQAGESCVFWVHSLQSLLLQELPAEPQLEIIQPNAPTDGASARLAGVHQYLDEIYNLSR